MIIMQKQVHIKIAVFSYSPHTRTFIDINRLIANVIVFPGIVNWNSKTSDMIKTLS